MRIVVTGASGNVGSALVRRLLADGEHDVVGVSRRVPEGLPTPWRATDIGTPEAFGELVRAFEGADAVVHLAWQIQPGRDEAQLWRVNVLGTRNVLTAARRAGVRHVVAASSVGAYGPGPKDHPVDETWPVTGITSSSYSRHKVELEWMLDDLAELEPDMVVSRLRPGLIFQASAASEIATLFLGPFVPRSLAGRVPLPAVPLSPKLRFQAVHTDDVAEAFATVLRERAPGAYNVATPDVLGPDDLARAIGAGRSFPVPASALRAAATLTWWAHLQPTDPGWLDLAASVPILDASRLAALGWSPSRSGESALGELVRGIRERRTDPANPPLASKR